MSKKKKNKFANAIIVFVLVITTVITGCLLYEYHRLGEPMPSDVAKLFYGFYGGELLIVALRQVFGSDVVAKTKNSEDSI